MILIVLAVIFVILNIFDIMLTNKVLRSGGVELNPIMAKMMSLLGDNWWTSKVVAGLVLFACVYGTYKWQPGIAMVLMACADALYIWVVWNNWKESKK